MIESFRISDNLIFCTTSISNEFIVIDVDKFFNYLSKNDLLYYENHDFTTGQYHSTSHQLTIEEYFEFGDYEIILNDLNNFYKC